MHRDICRTLLVFVSLLFLSTPGFAQPSGPVPPRAGVNSYIVIMRGDPVVSYDGGVSGFPATRRKGRADLAVKSAPGRAYSEYLKSEHDRSLRAAGVDASTKVHDYTVALNGYSAILTRHQVDAIRAQKGVLLVLEDRMRFKQTDSSPAFLGLTVTGGAYASGFTGEGVVVGIIDSGIWPEHPAFADDGSYPAPPTRPLPCDFGNIAHNPDDAPFICNRKLIGAYQFLDTYRLVFGAEPDEFDSARDDDGHGTHTASTAAGNAGVQASLYGLPLATISGIAPRAHVIAYKGLGNRGGFTSDLAAAIDQAVADGVDVINYSIGGGAATPGADELAFLVAADFDVFVAAPAGDSGPNAATIANPGTVPWLTTAGASTQRRFFKGTVILGNDLKFTGASLTPALGSTPLVDAADAGSETCVPGELNQAVVTGKIVLCLAGGVGRTEKSRAVFEAGGLGMILYNSNDVGNLFTDTHWVPSAHVDNTAGLRIKTYLERAREPTARIQTREGDGPATANWRHAPTMAIFSSRGPNPLAPDIIKPDVTAPGIQIVAGASPFPDPDAVAGQSFQAIAGTSISSAHVAGVFALLKQAHPEWSPAMARSALMTTADRGVLDNDRASQADPFDMGAGHIDPGGGWTKGSITAPGLVYDAGFIHYLGFLCGVFPALFSDQGTTCAFLEAIGIPTQAHNLNYPSIGIAEVVGSQTVVRTVTSVATESGPVTYHANVKAPPGYTVSVSPSVITLATGETADFSLTVTNVGAPVGEWRSGSFTWESKAYSVSSPIAVKGRLFRAPAEVSGSGESGSATFDAAFGYTGSYTAGAHGLVAATVTTDNVLQDPDQSFSPSDVATGGANLHQFTLSGAAFLRIAMPPEATEASADLDIYVYDPSNTLVAASTGPGTDELVEILLPADGTWTVYVHGWEAPGGDSDYNMWTWMVPLAAGGSLSIDSAPASATLGNVDPIVVSWSGLTSGSLADWYLGAVSHTGDAGLMGLTLIEVDNRP